MGGARHGTGSVRLVHLADYGGTYPGSFVPMVQAVLEAGKRRGWEVRAVFSALARDRPWLERLRADGLDCRLASADRDGIGGAVRESVEGPQRTILHTHFTAFDLAAAAAARREQGALAYWHLHSALRPGPWWQARNVVKLGLLSRGVQEILCVAPNILDQARKRLAPPGRLALVPNAIDLDRFPPADPGRRHSAREAIGLPQQTPVILHFGWDWHRKGGDLFLRAIAALPADEERPGEPIAVTVGAPPEAAELARSLGIAGRVRVLPPSDDVAELYAAADLFAAPSRGEGHPFAVVEALASGLPVVASPIPGHRMIAEKTAHCRIAAFDPGSLANAIAAELGRPAGEREAAGSVARAWVEAEMGIGAWSRRMLARYDRALAGG